MRSFPPAFRGWLNEEAPPPLEVVTPATLSRATAKRGGNILPRRSARLRMPLAAFEESEKRLGGSGSKMSDNEHSTAPLGNSEVSRVQHSPRNAIPELGQRREKDGEIPSTVRGKESGNILNEEPAWAKSVNDSGELEEEGRPLALEARPSASDGEVLAGESPADEVRISGDDAPPRASLCWACSVGEIPVATRADVGNPRDIGPVSGEDALAVLIDLHLAHACPSRPLEAEIYPSDAAEQREKRGHSFALPSGQKLPH